MIFYRGYVIEWIDYRNDFRIINPKYPYQTVAYIDGPLENVKRDIDYHIDVMHEVDFEVNENE